MNNNMNEQNNQGMNNAFPTNGTGTFFNNVSQPTNQPYMNNNINQPTNQSFTNNNINQPVNPPYNQTFTNNNINNNNNLNQNNYNNINTSNYVPNNNGKNNNKTKKKIIPIVVIVVIVVILLALIGRNLNSTEKYENNLNSPSNSSITENDSGTPKNSTVNPGETIKIREDKYLNIDFKYLSYDSTGYAEDRNVLFKAEITNKSKEKKYMTGTEISIYDSSNNKIGHCFPYSSAEREEGSMSPMIEPEKTMIVYYYCYILSTSDLSQIDKAKYEKTYMNSDFKDETVQYYLNIN